MRYLLAAGFARSAVVRTTDSEFLAFPGFTGCASFLMPPSPQTGVLLVVRA